MESFFEFELIFFPVNMLSHSKLNGFLGFTEFSNFKATTVISNIRRNSVDTRAIFEFYLNSIFFDYGCRSHFNFASKL